jgi:hypothetical protein
MGDIGKFYVNNNNKLIRESQLSFNSHNSSVTNLSYRSMNSPIRATRESFDIEMVRR